MQDAFSVKFPWIVNLTSFIVGSRWHFVANDSAYRSTLFPLCFSLDCRKISQTYFAFFLMLECSVMGVFMSLDFFLFYVFWEVMLVPMFFLIGIWGGENREYAAIKFFYIRSLVQF